MIAKSLGRLHKVKATGQDSLGNKYASVEMMWNTETDPNYIEIVKNMSEEEQSKQRIGSKEQWYKGAVDYWDSQEATYDGVLGGYGAVHPVDSDTSTNMIVGQKDVISGFGSALDCGAGIGRIGKEVLKPLFAEVDILEPSATQINKAREFFSEGREFYQMGLESFNYEHKYDCVWLQWCLCYLTDTDLIEFLEKTKHTGLA